MYVTTGIAPFHGMVALVARSGCRFPQDAAGIVVILGS
jgi:hypothetical protein